MSVDSVPEDCSVSIGPSTSALLKTSSHARRQDVTASYTALAQACAATGDDARHAELVSDHPHDAWSLPASRAIALVHTGPGEAWALVRGAELLEQHQVAVVTPYYSGVVRPPAGPSPSGTTPADGAATSR